MSKDLMKDEHFHNFVMLHVGVRMLSATNAPENVAGARRYFDNFYEGAPKLYGDRFVTLNIHALIHTPDDVERSSLDFNILSAFPFENHLGEMKRAINNPHRVLAQYCRRLHSEIEILNHRPQVPKEIEVLKRKHQLMKMIRCKGYTFTIKHPDNTALLRNGNVVSIQRIFEDENGEFHATVRRYKIMDSAFRTRSSQSQISFSSMSINYVEIKDDRATEELEIPLHRIDQKMFKFSVNFVENGPMKTFAVPLVH